MIFPLLFFCFSIPLQYSYFLNIHLVIFLIPVSSCLKNLLALISRISAWFPSHQSSLLNIDKIFPRHISFLTLKSFLPLFLPLSFLFFLRLDRRLLSFSRSYLILFSLPLPLYPLTSLSHHSLSLYLTALFLHLLP
ncbi:membrane protein [Candidatus Omnitrophus magneticus]|uniref:Membrane protein n=1 Tax=Candidatus Omnitrophus magneticus TaxID=1609969 RepID=A0A0F0CTP8_9BACT|nr:membrane protein [Candidatus Omnitrophus magneticus]